MKTTAYWLTLCALAMTACVLYALGSVRANADTLTYVSTSNSTDTVVESTILDNSRYPDIIAKLECSGSDISDMISQCGIALRQMCPDGGTVKELGETPEGVLPAQVMVIVACRHEPSGA